MVTFHIWGRSERPPPQKEGGIDMTVPSRYRVTVLALAMVLAAAVLAVVLAKPAQTQAQATTITD